MSGQTPYHGAWNATELLCFETTEFTGVEYRELVKDVEQNMGNLPDFKIEDGLNLKRVSPTNLDEEVKVAEWKLLDPTAAHGGMGKTLEILQRHYY